MEPRNIIIVGLNKSGKSTITNQILKGCTKVDNLKEIGCEIHKAEKSIRSTHYKITVLDSDGFGTDIATAQQTVIKLNDLVMMKKIIAFINLVIFVIRADRLEGDDNRIIMSVLELFNRSQLSRISCLIITHCEYYDERKRQDITTQFVKDEYTSDIGSLMEKGIITTGFASPDVCNEYFLETIQTQNKTDLEKVENLIVEASNPIDTAQLFYEIHAKELDNVLDITKLPYAKELHNESDTTVLHHIREPRNRRPSFWKLCILL